MIQHHKDISSPRFNSIPINAKKQDFFFSQVDAKFHMEKLRSPNIGKPWKRRTQEEDQ